MSSQQGFNPLGVQFPIGHFFYKSFQLVIITVQYFFNKNVKKLAFFGLTNCYGKKDYQHYQPSPCLCSVVVSMFYLLRQTK